MMRRVDSRRITGPHLLGVSSGAAVEVALDEGMGHEDAVAAWVGRASAMAERLGWPAMGTPFAWGARRWDDRPSEADVAPGQELGPGLSLALASPPDLLETACLVAEMAADDAPDLEALHAEQSREANPALRALLNHAHTQGWPAFWDDEGVTLGYGPHARTWPLDQIPEPSEIMDAPGRIPVALVTGTNGKTTTSRMLARMARAGGFIDALTSSDAIAVAGAVVRNGDWSGPGAARTALRDPRATLAVLETARGGLLRRGVAIADADVAVVTNIGADHLGEYGIDTLAGMAEAKLAVAYGLRHGGLLIVNGMCPYLTAALPAVRARRPDLQVGTFRDDGSDGVVIGGDLLRWVDVPATLGGLARHNVENALAAIAAARVLGVSERAIAAALRSFAPSVEDSSGRLNVIDWHGVTVIVDFAHNPDGLARLAPLMRGLPAARRAVMLGTAGDRTDAILDACAREVAAYGCDHLVVKELAGYLRGRQPGEVPARLREGLVHNGVPDDAIELADDDVDGARKLLAWARPGDLVLLLVHERLDEVLALLADTPAPSNG